MVPALPLTMSREDIAEAKRLAFIIDDDPKALLELVRAAQNVGQDCASVSELIADGDIEVVAQRVGDAAKTLRTALAKFDA